MFTESTTLREKGSHNEVPTGLDGTELVAAMPPGQSVGDDPGARDNCKVTHMVITVKVICTQQGWMGPSYHCVDDQALEVPLGSAGSGL